MWTGTRVLVHSGSSGLGGSDCAQPRPWIAATPSPLTFGRIVRGTTSQESLTIANRGTLDLAIGGVTPPAVPFTLLSQSCSGVTLGPGAACTMSLEFGSPTAGTYSSEVERPRRTHISPLWLCP